MTHSCWAQEESGAFLHRVSWTGLRHHCCPDWNPLRDSHWRKMTHYSTTWTLQTTHKGRSEVAHTCIYCTCTYIPFHQNAFVYERILPSTETAIDILYVVYHNTLYMLYLWSIDSMQVIWHRFTRPRYRSFQRWQLSHTHHSTYICDHTKHSHIIIRCYLSVC